MSQQQQNNTFYMKVKVSLDLECSKKPRIHLLEKDLHLSLFYFNMMRLNLNKPKQVFLTEKKKCLFTETISKYDYLIHDKEVLTAHLVLQIIFSNKKKNNRFINCSNIIQLGNATDELRES